MSETERIMIECRYILSLNKSYQEIANKLGISLNKVIDDQENKLKDIDKILYYRIKKRKIR